jgi:hypothetical protein
MVTSLRGSILSGRLLPWNHRHDGLVTRIPRVEGLDVGVNVKDHVGSRIFSDSKGRLIFVLSSIVLQSLIHRLPLIILRLLVVNRNHSVAAPTPIVKFSKELSTGFLFSRFKF